jgi:hypothetical protein
MEGSGKSIEVWVDSPAHGAEKSIACLENQPILET